MEKDMMNNARVGKTRDASHALPILTMRIKIMHTKTFTKTPVYLEFMSRLPSLDEIEFENTEEEIVINLKMKSAENFL